MFLSYCSLKQFSVINLYLYFYSSNFSFDFISREDGAFVIDLSYLKLYFSILSISVFYEKNTFNEYLKGPAAFETRKFAQI